MESRDEETGLTRRELLQRATVDGRGSIGLAIVASLFILGAGLLWVQWAWLLETLDRVFLFGQEKSASLAAMLFIVGGIAAILAFICRMGSRYWSGRAKLLQLFDEKSTSVG